MNALKMDNVLFECFYCKYMWKEIVRKFSIFGKEMLPKKGKKEENLDFRKWKLCF